MLILQHPEVAFRSCENCHRWLHDKDTGAVVMDKRGCEPGDPGKPVKRPSHEPVPCHLEKGCPKGRNRHPTEPDIDHSLAPYNWRAYQHYKGCKAVLQWPEDPIVRANAQIIADSEGLVGWLDRQRLIQSQELTNRMILQIVSASAAS